MFFFSLRHLSMHLAQSKKTAQRWNKNIFYQPSRRGRRRRRKSPRSSLQGGTAWEIVTNTENKGWNLPKWKFSFSAMLCLMLCLLSCNNLTAGKIGLEARRVQWGQKCALRKCNMWLTLYQLSKCQASEMYCAFHFFFLSRATFWSSECILLCWNWRPPTFIGRCW